MALPLRETKILGNSANLGQQKICLIFNMLNLNMGHFIQMKISKLMLQWGTKVQERGQPVLKMLFWEMS